MNRLLAFTPSKSEYAATWRTHRDFLGELVMDAAPLVNYEDRRLLVAFLPFVGWLEGRGYAVDRETVLNRTNVEAFLSATSGEFSVGSLRTFRSHIVSVIAGLGGDVEPLGGTAKFSRSIPSVPYTDDEQGWLVSWATHRLNDYTRRNSKLAVALGLGAGLTSGEAMLLNRTHINVTDDGVAIEVPGSRLVVVHHTFEDLFIGAFSLGDPHAPLLLADATHRDCKTLNKFLNTQRRRTDIPVNFRKMRTTWIVRHLTDGIPADVLMRAAGVATLAGLTRFMRYVPDRPHDVQRSALRGAPS
jgi:integrase